MAPRKNPFVELAEALEIAIPTVQSFVPEEDVQFEVLPSSAPVQPPKAASRVTHATKCLDCNRSKTSGKMVLQFSAGHYSKCVSPSFHLKGI
jgi:hypothetical protein